MIEHARLFLERVLPWAPLGDPDAYGTIHFTIPDKKGGSDRPIWVGRAAGTPDELLKEVNRAAKNESNQSDIYVCMSTQRLVEQVRTANGYEYTKAKRSAQNAVHLRSLFLDIDVKGDGYATTRDAAAALKEFLETTGMPRPSMIVGSGSGGMHVYWCLDEALTPAQWQPLAQGLVEATKQAGLLCDTQVTVDAARILRVPGTTNWKGGKPKPVQLHIPSIVNEDYSVEYIRSVLAPYIPTRPALSLVQGGVNSELTSGIVQQARPVDLRTVAEAGCGFIEEALDTGGSGFDNPLWMLATLAATFAEDGRQVAHEMAQGHPEYDPDETDALYDRKLQEREEKNLGWPSCQTIHNAGCKHCGSCRFLPAGKSPLNLANVRSRVKDADDLPAGYLRDPVNLTIYRQIADGEDVSHIQLAPYAVYDGYIADAGEPCLIFKTRHPRSGVVSPVTVPFSALGSVEALARILNGASMGCNRNRAQAFGDFFMAWIDVLRQNQDAINTAPFGWHYENGKLAGFAYGGELFTSGGTKSTNTPQQVVARRYTAHGSIEPWAKIREVVEESKRSALDVILASSFAAPLVALTGHSGLVISAISNSGAGKSTAMRVAQAVWGRPLTKQLNDTENSVMGEIEQTRHLPFYWDEIKSAEQANHFTNFVFRVAQGIGKSRMKADTSLREVNTFQTMVLAASNASLLAEVVNRTKGTSAGMMRIFEIDVPHGEIKRSTAEVTALTRQLDHNYGHAGAIYAKFLGQKAEVIEQEVQRVHEALEKKLGATQEERMWIATIACLYVGATYSNKLNLTNIEVKPMLNYLVAQLKNLRRERGGLDGEVTTEEGLASVAAEFFGSMRRRRTLVTDQIFLTQGKQPKTRVLNDVSQLEVPDVHIAQQNRIIRVRVTALRDWCMQTGHPYRAVKNQMEKVYGGSLINARLGAGTSFAMPPQRVLQMQVRGTDLEVLCDPENAQDIAATADVAS